MEKDEFLGIAAHDLKNPIGGIRGLAEMLLLYRDDLGEEQMNEMLQSMIDSSERMFELIKNLLDVNALERGGMPVHLIDFDLSMPVFLIADTYRQRAAAKNITLHYEREEGFMVVADEQATVQVLDNLVSNAVKYSPEGKNIYLRLKKSFLPNEQTVRFEVQDEGPGLSDNDKTKLFGKFARLSAQPTGGEHSTGLGLSIVKKMVETMNGKVWCESELGKGATFIVELPAAEQKQ
jgi:signal transduction histidine kinase